MELHDAYKQKMAAQLKEWNAQIDLFGAKAENAGADIKVKHAELLHRLHAQQQVASEKMQELEKAGVETWDQIKITADKIWDNLKDGVSEAHSKFK